MGAAGNIREGGGFDNGVGFVVEESADRHERNPVLLIGSDCVSDDASGPCRGVKAALELVQPDKHSFATVKQTLTFRQESSRPP